MSEELFEKYCRGALSVEETEELKRILRDDPKGRGEFARYMHERSILVQLSGRKAGEKDISSAPARSTASRGRRSRRAPGSGTWTPLVIAAGVIIAVVVGLMLIPTGAPSIAPTPVASRPEAVPAPVTPVKAPEKTPVNAPVPEARKIVRTPLPVPTRSPGDRRAEARPEAPKAVPRAVVRKPEPKKPPTKPAPPAPGTIPAVATLAAVKGDVHVAGKPVRVGQPILAGQGLTVAGDEGSALVAFPDGSRVTISGGSVVREITAREGKRVFLEKGALTADVRKQPDGEPMVFATPQGKATVLGTQLRLAVDPVEAPGATRLEVTEGRVRLTRNDGRSVLVRSAHFALAAPGTALVARRITPPVAPFTTMPAWADTYDANWGSAADWQLGAGVTEKGLRVSRAAQGSSVRVLVLDVPANREVEISAFLKCPEFNGDYWFEVGTRLGAHKADDFDLQPGGWTVLHKFDGTNRNGNMNRWVRYARTVRTGGSRKITVGFKVGSRGGGGPVAGCDDLRITVK